LIRGWRSTRTRGGSDGCDQRSRQTACQIHEVSLDTHRLDIAFHTCKSFASCARSGFGELTGSDAWSPSSVLPSTMSCVRGWSRREYISFCPCRSKSAQRARGGSSNQHKLQVNGGPGMQTRPETRLYHKFQGPIFKLERAAVSIYVS